MKKNIKVTYKSIAYFFLFIFVFVFFIAIGILPNISISDEKTYILKYLFIFLIIDGMIGVILSLINQTLENAKKDNTAFIIRRKFINKYCNIKVLFSISIIFIIFLFFMVVVKDRLNEIEYKDLIYSLKDNSDYDNRITKKNSTRDYKSLNSNMFLGYKVENKEIIESYVCFIYDAKLTCLKLGKNNYERNKTKVENIFGENSCFDYNNNYQCIDSKYNVNIKNNGNLSVMIEYSEDDKDYCYSKENTFKCNLIKDYE